MRDQNQFGALADSDSERLSNADTRDRHRSPWKLGSALGKGGAAADAAAPSDPSSGVLLAPEALAQIQSLFQQGFEFNIKPLAEQIAAGNATALQAVAVATAAEAVAKGVQKQLYAEKYARRNVMEREKTISISPLKIVFGERQDRSEAACKAVLGVLGKYTGEPQEYWQELLSDFVIIPQKGKQQGKYTVTFKVQKWEDARLIMKSSKKEQFQQGQQKLYTRVWLEQHEADNKKRILQHPAFREASDIIFSKPQNMPGKVYKMGWDLDRAYTIIDGVKTYWYADDLQQPAAQGEGPSGGVAPMEQQ